MPNIVNPEIPPEITTFLLKAMEVENKKRFASAKEMRQALRKAVADIKQRENDARKAVYWTEQLELEKERQLGEQKRLEFEEKEKKRTNELLRKAEERAKEAERRLSEQSPQKTKAKQAQIPSTVPIPQVEFLEFKQESSKTEAEELANDGNFELLKIDVFPSEKYEKFPSAEAQSYSFGTTDSLSELNQSSYFGSLLPETDEQETVIRFTSPAQKEKKESRFSFNKFFSLPVLGIGLLIILGAFLFFRTTSSGNSANQTDSSKILAPTPAATISPTVAPTAEPPVSPTAETNTAPEQTTLDKNESESKAKTTKSQPKATKPSKTQPKTRKIKNLDCIFNDDCQ
jgi:type IV secretory pathway VirB10-like protein